MSFDGVFAGVIARQLNKELNGAKIEKVQQPEPDEIILQVNSSAGRKKLLLCINPQGARVHYTSLAYENPSEAPNFCMLLRKHIQGGRIVSVTQPGTERLIAFDIETVNELGYSVNKRLIAETMGKHSNIILVDTESEKIIDSIKRVSLDVNRYRQLLPGFKYVLPPSQGKHDFWTLDGASDIDVSDIQGLSGGLRAEIKNAADAAAVRDSLLTGDLFPAVYLKPDGTPADVHAVKLKTLEDSCEVLRFDTVGEALDYFYSHKAESNRVLQRSAELTRTLNGLIDKQLLKKQRLLDELKQADRADEFRIKGELITANIGRIKPGAKSAKVISYYDGSEVEIALDEKLSAAKNAQAYFKRYSKLKNSVKEKLSQLRECEDEIAYLRSVQGLIPGSSTHEELDLIRAELIAEGHLRGKKAAERGRKSSKPKPRRFKTASGYELCVGRSSAENDYITFKLGGKTDLWFHTKDIPGSHLVLFTNGEEVDADTIYEAAGIAAWFSGAKDSENVPVDYVPLRYVKKPAGAKPGMVIFTNNRTVWINPRAPE